MTFDSVYSMITPQHIIKKSWFVDYFSGDSNKAWWTFNNVAGTGSQAMVDAANGGFQITTGGSTGNRSGITFNNIRHYSNTGAKLIAIVDRDTVTRNDVGLTDVADMSTSDNYTTMNHDSTVCFVNMRTANGTSQTTTATSIAVSENKILVLINILSASSQISLNGIFEATTTSTLPSVALQPNYLVRAQTTGGKSGRISYLEAYNT